MTSNKFSQKDQDFADAMATKLRLNREKLKQTQTADDKINQLTPEQREQIGEFSLSIIRSAMDDHPDLDPLEAHQMMEFFGA